MDINRECMMVTIGSLNITEWQTVAWIQNMKNLDIRTRTYQSQTCQKLEGQRKIALNHGCNTLLTGFFSDVMRFICKHTNKENWWARVLRAIASNLVTNTLLISLPKSDLTFPLVASRAKALASHMWICVGMPATLSDRSYWRLTHPSGGASVLKSGGEVLDDPGPASEVDAIVLGHGKPHDVFVSGSLAVPTRNPRSWLLPCEDI